MLLRFNLLVARQDVNPPYEQKTTKENVFPRKNSSMPPSVIKSPPYTDLSAVLSRDCFGPIALTEVLNDGEWLTMK